jgi:uncharacterized protein (TIGR03435 family)
MAQSTPAYDAVSVKANKSGNGGTSVDIDNDSYAARNVSLENLIAYAYDLQSTDLISGLPGWAKSARFDIEAKMDADTVAELKKMSRDESANVRRMMMQAMLADRFKLTTHPDTKEEQMYVLVIAKGGTKLKDADPNDTYATGLKGRDGGPAGGGSMSVNNGHMVAQGVPIVVLVGNLAGQLHRMVVDKTGLTGKYDFTIDLPRDSAPRDDGASEGPSLFTALQETLGLKLESTKGPVSGVAVDHVEQPSEN